MAIYMKFGAINGDVETAGFDKWIELNSFQWGVGRGIGSPVGGAQNREASAPSISEITVSKRMDITSVPLLMDAVLGELNTKVEIKFTTTTKNKTTTFLAYELTDCGLSGYSITSGGDMPTESLSLNFTKILETFSGMDAATQAKPVSTTINLAKITAE
jgi:type VI secretion system secreted protein Hcp